ncbi:MAG: hypothetical protein JJ863_16770 [Deltaproteobacteria bacterium]|nr:hypothetical protein [Deltaproteobacteria bacterium]
MKVLAAAALLLTACGASQDTAERCEIRVDGQCYGGRTEACQAARCPDRPCSILRSHPAQVSCADEAPAPAEPLRCDDLPESVPIFTIGALEGELTELVPERGSEESIYSLLSEVDLNGDSVPDFLETLVDVLDEETFEYQPMCNNVAQCCTRVLVGCDDDRVASLWDGDEGDVTLADRGRELEGLLYRDLLVSQRLGGVAEEEAMDRDQPMERTTRLRIDESYVYVPAEVTRLPGR